MSSSGLALEHANEKLRDDEEVVLRAVQGAGLALEFASERQGDGWPREFKMFKGDHGSPGEAQGWMENDGIRLWRSPALETSFTAFVVCLSRARQVARCAADCSGSSQPGWMRNSASCLMH